MDYYIQSPIMIQIRTMKISHYKIVFIIYLFGVNGNNRLILGSNITDIICLISLTVGTIKYLT